MQTPDLFIVMIDYDKLGREAIVDPNHSWGDALATVRAAIGDKHPVSYVLHIHDGVSEDRTLEALEIVAKEANAACAEPERDETEQRIHDWLRDHNRDHRKNWVAA